MRRTGAVLCVVGLAREAAVAGPPFAIGAAGIPVDLTSFAGLVSFGLCGALAPDLRAGDLIIGDAVVYQGQRIACDPAWADRLALALPGARRGLIAGSQAIVATADQKRALHTATGALATDMESHSAAAAAARAGLPLAVVRAVSDDAGGDLCRAAQAGFSPSGAPRIAAVLAALARRPWELPALIRTAVEAEAGFRALAVAAPSLRLQGEGGADEGGADGTA